ncbi:hypothetical protein OG612_45585 (plasmid) [Streptomyces sp. NBC_01527]|uniref:hypothetical protein n=1 Tax=Streptomyces sp. NBC_01527 TaxID=2903894 RepID=UPI002F90AD71
MQPPNDYLARQVRDHILSRPANYETGATMNGSHAQLSPGEEPETDPAVGITRLGVAGWAALLGGHTLLHNRYGSVVAENDEGDVTDVYTAAARALCLDEDQAYDLFRPDVATYAVLDALHQLAHGAPRIDWAEVQNGDADYRDPILTMHIKDSDWTHEQLMGPVHHHEDPPGHPAKDTRDELTAGAQIRVTYTARVTANYGGNIHLDNGTELPEHNALTDLSVITPGWQPGDIATCEGETLFRTRTSDGHDVWLNSEQNIVWDDRIDPAKVTLVTVKAG